MALRLFHFIVGTFLNRSCNMLLFSICVSALCGKIVSFVRFIVVSIHSGEIGLCIRAAHFENKWTLLNFLLINGFLWRKNASFAISRHYKRFDVFVEAEANKAAGKYNNASIDFQIEFYKKEGLTPYSATKLPITSDVPEGCVIVREHIPITNLFTCLWFNEVDRFTSRDQISFSTVRDKIWSKTNYTINMFFDCERRNFVVQGYHRDLLEQWSPPPPPPGGVAFVHPPPPITIIDENLNKTSDGVVVDSITNSQMKKVPTKRGKDRRWRRHRKIITGSKNATTN